jgi:hypothetical protein
MEQQAADTESESAGNRPEAEQQAGEREALRRRIRESLLRCPGAELSRPA